MKCIFCAQDSIGSISVEHIVPNSFGNTTAFLKRGIVCDKCNNYFARKVERPFLECESVQILRQELEIKNKKGKLIKHYPYPKTETDCVWQISETRYLVFTNECSTPKEISSRVSEYQSYLEGNDKFFIEENRILSRLLAKMAVEFFVYNCGSTKDVCEYVMSDVLFQPIRNYARYGSHKLWIYNARRIYARNEAFNVNLTRTINWEANWLFLKNGEVYFVIVMFGIEYAICINESTVKGYKKWLAENHGLSPLYTSKEKLQESFREYTDFFKNKK